MLIALYNETNSQRLIRTEAILVRACDLVVRDAARLAANASPEDLTRSTSHALEAFGGVEGGVWRAGFGSLAYAFPSYEGSSVKTDLPKAEEPTIRQVAESAVAANRPVAWKRDAPSQVLMLQGCPFPGKSDIAAWVMTRVVTVGGRPFLLATTGLALLLVVLLGSAALLARVLWRWSFRLRSIERALATGSADLPVLALTGQRDLDRIVGAINGAGIAAAEARRRSEELRQRVAEGERLAALGRVAAGVAHEIRNPMAAMRLKAENALAENTDPVRARDALRVVVDQVARMEQLVQNLLRSVQRSAVCREAVADVKCLLEEHAELFAEQAGRRPILVEAPEALDPPAHLDPSQIGRALDNLILNAIQNSPEGAPIKVSAKATAAGLQIAVADHGNGVAAEIRDHLFEPFATGRADGTGLGLAIVREIAEAHGGCATVEHRPDGTTFCIELPGGASR
jgi:signal transduction histidine kinase